MGSTPKNNDMMARLNRLEKRVSAMERTSTLTSASISEGDLTIRRGGNLRVIDGGNFDLRDGGDFNISDGGNIELRDGGDFVVSEGGDILLTDSGQLRIGNRSGLVVLNGSGGGNAAQFGNLYHGGNLLGKGLSVRKPNGELIAIIAQNEVDGSNWLSFYDGRGNEIWATDRISGYGQAYPQASFPWLKAHFADDWREITDSAWDTYYDSRFPCSHARVRVGFSVTFAGTASIGVRISLNGEVKYNTGAVTGGAQNFLTYVNLHDLPGVWPGQLATLRLEARKVSGSGKCFVRPYEIFGVGS